MSWQLFDWGAHTICAVAAVVLVSFSRAAAAAPFTNLDFEQAIVPPGTPSPGTVSSSLAFPGWTVRIGNSAINSVYYDYDGIGEAAVALYDKPAEDLGIPLLQDKYDALLIGQFGGTPTASLSQVGDIPAGARSIRLLAEYFRGPPTVYLNGTVVPLTFLSGSQLINGTAEFGADVSVSSGVTNVELRLENTLPPHGYIAGVDAITFSPNSIPEPNTSHLLGAAGALICTLRKRPWRWVKP